MITIEWQLRVDGYHFRTVQFLYLTPFYAGSGCPQPVPYDPIIEDVFVRP